MFDMIDSSSVKSDRYPDDVGGNIDSRYGVIRNRKHTTRSQVAHDPEIA